jgi:hypothetical protein
VFQAKDKRLSVCCDIDLKFHIRMLAGEYVTIEVDKLAQVTLD